MSFFKYGQRQPAGETTLRSVLTCAAARTIRCTFWRLTDGQDEGSGFTDTG